MLGVGLRVVRCDILEDVLRGSIAAGSGVAYGTPEEAHTRAGRESRPRRFLGLRLLRLFFVEEWLRGLLDVEFFRQTGDELFLGEILPTLVGVENPSSATIVCQGETFTFKLDQALADNGGIFLVIEASEGQSNGVSRAHSKAAQIKMVEEPTAAAIDIRADYVAKNGAPSAAAPKIFFRYYYVNSSTGEKSGVMLAETTWTAGA